MKADEWVAVDRFVEETSAGFYLDLHSRLAQDPVGVGSDILLLNYTDDQLAAWFAAQ
jgi:hypothetical protein